MLPGVASECKGCNAPVEQMYARWRAGPSMNVLGSRRGGLCGVWRLGPKGVGWSVVCSSYVRYRCRKEHHGWESTACQTFFLPECMFGLVWSAVVWMGARAGR